MWILLVQNKITVFTDGINLQTSNETKELFQHSYKLFSDV